MQINVNFLLGFTPQRGLRRSGVYAAAGFTPQHLLAIISEQQRQLIIAKYI